LQDERALAALREDVARYYSAKVERYGPTPEGVDWTCEPTQQLRFVQLLRLCDFSEPFSLNDLGCGWGALHGFIRQRHRGARVDYAGVDVSAAMIDAARARWANRRQVTFAVGHGCTRIADYSVASGIFNVRIDQPLALWESFIEQVLRDLAAHSRRGFAVNFLNVLPQGVEGKRELYRTPPQPWADFCRRELGARVEVLDSYGMREFTLLARP
jgi:SAM-dependent methyltransferase